MSDDPRTWYFGWLWLWLRADRDRMRRFIAVVTIPLLVGIAIGMSIMRMLC
ncbi:hypothetical protein [Amycolatopsis sp. NPDC059657]|uniref:hypothetical protein n=1 Tax=Amycolatopsis sp. NPDC059657 TaxID=3346899 RepID=UPI003671AB4A